jgi:elongation factor P
MLAYQQKINKSSSFILLLLLSLSVFARGIYQTDESFLAEVFNNNIPKSKVIWLNDDLQQEISGILGHNYKGDDFLKEADCERKSLQYSYKDDDAYTFMSLDDYEQYTINAEDIEDEKNYLVEGLEGVISILLEGVLVAIELPSAVPLEIIETAPGIKGASATARTKPATLATGLEVQVPEYIEQGEIIKVNTVSGKFMSRA